MSFFSKESRFTHRRLQLEQLEERALLSVNAGTDLSAAAGLFSVLPSPGTAPVQVQATSELPLITNVSLSKWSGRYDGTSHSITVTDPDAATDTICYSLDGETYNLTENPAFTEIGAYAVYVKVSRAGFTDWFGSSTVTIKDLPVQVETKIAVSSTLPAETEIGDPESLSVVEINETFYVSVYVKSTNSNIGVIGGYCTLYYESDSLIPVEYTPSKIFPKETMMNYSSRANHYLSAFGGAADLGSGGYGRTSWALIGTYSFTPRETGTFTISNGMARNRKGAEVESWGFVLKGGKTISNSYDSVTVTVHSDLPDITDITVSDPLAVYDAAPHTVTLTGLESGDIIRYSADGLTYSLTEAPARTDAGTDTVYVRVSRAGCNDWYGKTSLTVTPRQLTVEGTTVRTKTYDGTVTAEIANTGTLTGVITGDSVDFTIASCAYNSPNADSSAEAAVTYTLTGTDAANYSIADSAVIGTITPKAVTFSAVTAASRTYSASDTSAEITDYEFAPGTIIGTDQVEAVSITAEFANAGPGIGIGVTVTDAVFDNTNYVFTSELCAATSAEIWAKVEADKASGSGAGSLQETVKETAANHGTKVILDSALHGAAVTVTETLTLDGVSLEFDDGETGNVTIRSTDTQNPIAEITGNVNVSDITFTGKNESGEIIKRRTSAVIICSGAQAVLTNCSFTDNSSADFGAAVYNLNGTLTLDNATFSNNASSKQGGALANNGGTIYLTDTDFSNNTVSGQNNGAAIMSTGTIEMTGGSFTGNRNTSESNGGNGGAVASLGGAITFTDVTFSGNNAGQAVYTSHTSSAASTDCGGALRIVNSTVTLNGCTFNDNTAYNGGAISVANGAFLNINGCEFNDNTAVYGGAIASSGTVVIGGWTNTANETIRTTFTGNQAGGYTAGSTKFGNGGAINNTSNGNLTVTNAQFTENTVLSGTDYALGGSGGAIENWGTAEIISSSFESNKAKNGGAVANGQLQSGTQYGALILTDVTLTNNSAQYGGGLLNTAAAAITNLAATGNTADRNGGAVSNTTAKVTEGETETTYAGSIIFYGISTITSNSCNTTTGYGGGILNINGTRFEIASDAVVTTDNNAGPDQPNHGIDFLSDGAECINCNVGTNLIGTDIVFIEPASSAPSAGTAEPQATSGKTGITYTRVQYPTQEALCDLDGDFFIGPGDYSYLNSAWFSEEGDVNWNPRADINGDGSVDMLDRALIAHIWFEQFTMDDLVYSEYVKTVTYFSGDIEIEGGTNRE